MDANRRRALLSCLYGAGWVGLRSLATGLPISFLLNPRRAAADGCLITAPQYLIWSTGPGGESINANVPGSYLDPGIYHPTDPQMAATNMTVGGQTYQAAKPWATLDPTTILSRTCFFHHATYTNSHGDSAKVNRLMGAVFRSEMMISMFCKQLAPCLQTVQTAPVLLSPNLITFKGATQPYINPGLLKNVLTPPTGALLDLQKIRDTNLDKLNAVLKQNGTTSQRAILDQYALSQTQVRSLSLQLLNDLSSISVANDDRINENIAAAVLLKMNVTPVVVVSYQFSGDNHGDPGLASETSLHVASITALNDLIARLTSYGLQDKATIAFHSVFGRTLAASSHRGNTDGRNHNDKHQTAVIIGKPFKSSLVGGVVSMGAGKDFRAQGFDSSTGAANDGGDVPYEDTLGALGKTLGAGLGIPQTVLDYQITSGKIVTGALA